VPRRGLASSRVDGSPSSAPSKRALAGPTKPSTSCSPELLSNVTTATRSVSRRRSAIRRATGTAGDASPVADCAAAARSPRTGGSMSIATTTLRVSHVSERSSTSAQIIFAARSEP
jgi:hypothetical protein